MFYKKSTELISEFSNVVGYKSMSINRVTAIQNVTSKYKCIFEK